MRNTRTVGRGSSILSLFFLIGTLLLISGCNPFAPETPSLPIVARIFVNGYPWTGSDLIRSRPDYVEGAVLIRVELTGGSGDGFQITCQEGTRASSSTVEGSFSRDFRLDGSIRIESGDQAPIELTLKIINSPPELGSNPPVMRIPTIGDLESYLWTHSVNGCDAASGAFTYESGAWDSDEPFGDRLEVKMIVSGPMADGTSGTYALFTAEDAFGGARTYTRCDGEWIPVESEIYCLLGENDDQPRVHLLSCPPVTPPVTPPDQGVVAGYYKIELWVRDRLGLEDHRVFTRTIYQDTHCS